MSDSMIKKVSTIILTILLFVTVLNSVFNVSAGFIKYDDQGIWVDEFNNLNDIQDISPSLEKNGSKIVLLQGNEPIKYNHDEYPDNVEAWSLTRGISGYPIGESIARLISPNKIPADKFTTKISAINSLDGNYLETISTMSDPVTEIMFSPMHHFRFNINQKVENINNVTLKWWFGDYKADANLKQVSIWIWTYGNLVENWKTIDTVTYDELNITSQEDNPDLWSLLTGETYISDEGYIDIIMVGIPKDGLTRYDRPFLHTDFVELEVTTNFGYLPKGEIVSKPITITPTEDFAGWESVFWTGSKPSKSTSITIQILDEYSEVIGDYKGTNSPLDISSIANSTIKIKATLLSNSLDVTPYLDSWGISWQRTDGYADSFTNTYRVKESEGISIIAGDIKIDEFYSDWSIFGNNPDNTRAYDGAGITQKPDDIYWYSRADNVGGGFRQIVSSNGKIYVSSSDKKIYSFNSTRNNSGGKLQYPTDTSKALYNVESCIGTSNNVLVIGNCNKNSANKLYGLSTLNLSIELWNHTVSSDPICFSAPPTIYDDKVFVSSWSGQSWDFPILSFLSEFLDVNNKFIVLDLITGEPKFDPISLPAGSLSAPAIGEDMVFVGCQNIYGSSLFAYDIDTGEEVWNASVGTIGRASPVYADGKVFVLSRIRENLTSLGTNKVFAIDAATGEDLWNVSIGQGKISALINILGGMDFFQLFFNSAPMSTPAYKDGTLYVMSQSGELFAFNSNNGEIIWSYDMSEDSSLTYFVSSPVVVNEQVYAVSGETQIYAFSTKNYGEDIKPLWTYQVNNSLYEFSFPPDFTASPIITDGLMMLSCIENTRDMSGGIYAVGNYTPNYRGSIISNDIHLPSGYWWDTFDAEFDDTENNTITFTILDNGDEINVNGNESDLSDINSRIIKLKASFEITNSSEADPILHSWHVNWSKENAAPEFDEDSFTPGQESWINDLTPTCSIKVTDVGVDGVISGLDMDSAKFKIEYLDSNENKLSDWQQAISDNSTGSNSATLYGDIDDLDVNVDDLYNVSFRISDLAGNQVTYTKSDFKFDADTPLSWIENDESFEGEKLKEQFLIKANGSDDASGIHSIELKYRSKKSESDSWGETWYIYDAPDTSAPYEWQFKTTASGYYQVVSVAKDKADNEETIDSANAIAFVFDMRPPSLESAEVLTSPNVRTRLELTVSDDLELDNLYYAFDQENWEDFELDIGDNELTTIWEIPEDDWTNILDEGTRVYFKITDICGNEYISSLEIEKGENASNYYIDSSDFSEWHWDNKFTLSVNYPDEFDIEGVTLSYKYSKDNKNWPENYTFYDNKSDEDSYKWSITPPKESGYYKFKAELFDASGEVYEAYTETINVTMFPTTLILLLIIILIALLIVGSIVIVKMRRKKRV